jgi:hypothetical protein
MFVTEPKGVTSLAFLARRGRRCHDQPSSQVGSIEIDAAECEMIDRLAPDRPKHYLYLRLVLHYRELAAQHAQGACN